MNRNLEKCHICPIYFLYDLIWAPGKEAGFLWVPNWPLRTHKIFDYYFRVVFFSESIYLRCLPTKRQSNLFQLSSQIPDLVLHLNCTWYKRWNRDFWKLQRRAIATSVACSKRRIKACFIWKCYNCPLTHWHFILFFMNTE